MSWSSQHYFQGESNTDSGNAYFEDNSLMRQDDLDPENDFRYELSYSLDQQFYGTVIADSIDHAKGLLSELSWKPYSTKYSGRGVDISRVLETAHFMFQDGVVAFSEIGKIAGRFGNDTPSGYPTIEELLAEKVKELKDLKKAYEEKLIEFTN